MPTALEAVKQALYNEVRSQAFYRLAADRAERDDTRVLFFELGDLEAGHARELARRIAHLPLAPDFDPEAYVAELEHDVSATVPAQDARTVESGNLREVFKLAKRLEVESRDGYRRLARHADTDDVRAFCEELSRQEEGHLEEIRKLELSLDMAEEARPAL